MRPAGRRRASRITARGAVEPADAAALVAAAAGIVALTGTVVPAGTGLLRTGVAALTVAGLSRATTLSGAPTLSRTTLTLLGGP